MRKNIAITVINKPINHKKRDMKNRNRKSTNFIFSSPVGFLFVPEG